jgi:hypothetical protein
METHTVHLEMFHMYSISYPANSTLHSNSSHVHRKCDSSTLAMSCEIRSWSSRRYCGTGKWYTWSFTFVEVAWSKVRWSRGPRNGCCPSYSSLLLLRCRFPLTVIGAPLGGWYVIINIAKKKSNQFPCCFQVFSCSYLQPFRKYTNSFYPNHV